MRAASPTRGVRLVPGFWFGPAAAMRGVRLPGPWAGSPAAAAAPTASTQWARSEAQPGLHFLQGVLWALTLGFPALSFNPEAATARSRDTARRNCVHVGVERIGQWLSRAPEGEGRCRRRGAFGWAFCCGQAGRRLVWADPMQGHIYGIYGWRAVLLLRRYVQGAFAGFEAAVRGRRRWHLPQPFTAGRPTLSSEARVPRSAHRAVPCEMAPARGPVHFQAPAPHAWAERCFRFRYVVDSLLLLPY